MLVYSYRQQPSGSRSFRQSGGHRHAETRRTGTRSVQKKGGERSRNTNEQAMRGNLCLKIFVFQLVPWLKFNLSISYLAMSALMRFLSSDDGGCRLDIFQLKEEELQYGTPTLQKLASCISLLDTIQTFGIEGVSEYVRFLDDDTLEDPLTAQAIRSRLLGVSPSFAKSMFCVHPVS